MLRILDPFSQKEQQSFGRSKEAATVAALQQIRHQMSCTQHLTLPAHLRYGPIPDAGEGGDPYHAGQACADFRAYWELLRTRGCKWSRQQISWMHCANAGGNLYHELRQGKLMLMPSFTSGFQKMLKWLMAPAPGACLSFLPSERVKYPCRPAHESRLRLVLSGHTERSYALPGVVRAVMERLEQRAQ